MTPNPDNGKEQMEFREFRAFYQHAVILKSGEKMKCFELMGPDILSAKDSGSIYTLVEIAKVRELEERVRELENELNRKDILLKIADELITNENAKQDWENAKRTPRVN